VLCVGLGVGSLVGCLVGSAAIEGRKDGFGVGILDGRCVGAMGFGVGDTGCRVGSGTFPIEKVTDFCLKLPPPETNFS